MDKKNIIFFYTIFSLWMVLEYFILGPFSLVRIHDSADIHLPRLIYFASNFLNEGLTYWSPQMGAGVDRLSNGFSIYYFLTILFILLKPWIAYSSFYFIQHFISSYFTYRICRDTLHLDKLSALVAGVLFSYVQAYQFDFGLGFSAFPMIIWISDKIMFNPVRWKYLKIISLGLGYSFVAPFHMSIVYTLPTILLWKLLIRNCYDIKVYLNLLLFSIFCILPQLDLIQSLILNSQDSHRIGRDYSLQNFGGGLFSYSIEVTISILKNNILPLSLTIFAFHLSLKKIKYFHNLIFTIILLLTITDRKSVV